MLDVVASVRPLDLLAAAGPPQLRSTLIDSLADRVMRKICFGLFQRVRRNVQLASCTNTVMTREASLDSLPQPMLAAVLEIAPVRGRMIIVVEGNLIGGIVDAMCGANGPDPLIRPELSTMENRVGRQIIDLAARAIGEVSAGFSGFTLSVIQYETAIGMLTAADPEEWMINITATLDTGLAFGSVTVILPHALFSGLDSKVSNQGRPAGQGGSDRRWASMLASRTDVTPVQLRLELARAWVPIALVQAVRPGHILPLRVQSEAIAVVGGIDLFAADFGQSNGYVCCRPKSLRQEEGDAAMTTQAELKPAAAEAERVELEKLPPRHRDGPAIPGKTALERVQVLLTVELGRTNILIRDLRQIRSGQVIELDQTVGEPLGIFANGQRLAVGEVVAVGKDQYGVRVTALADETERNGDAEA